MEDWKNNILNSAKGITKGSPPSDAFDRILAKANEQKKKEKNAFGWIAVAATVSIIVMLNVFVIVDHENDQSVTKQNRIEYAIPLVKSYNIYENEY